jgi:glycerol-3-phosphate dehydrogenase
MGKILRQPAEFSESSYDLIIIGGGIYGIMLSMEATRRGLRSLLLERADFGGATTFNCLRILHGGFRYLQSMDLKRFRESVAERKWFLKHFRSLVKPLPCLMPLYGRGLHRRSILRAANWINELLSYNRNHGVPPEIHLPKGEVISTRQTKKIVEDIDGNGLKGAIIWHDAIMPDSQRIVIEILRWSCGNGARALNYTAATRLLKSENRVCGMVGKDLVTGKSYEYASPIVINAAGPWCREIAEMFDRDKPDLFRSSIAWNVLLDKDPISTHALAVTPNMPKARTYFLLPWKDKILAGTGHAPWLQNADNPKVADEVLMAFINDLNRALPQLNLKPADILHVFSGLLPATKTSGVKLAKREVIIDHAQTGGSQGFFSISGVKFTTSRLVAEKTLNLIFPAKQFDTRIFEQNSIFDLPDTAENRGIFNLDRKSFFEDNQWKDKLSTLVEEESVCYLDDVVMRRTNLWERSEMIKTATRYLGDLFKLKDVGFKSRMQRL